MAHSVINQNGKIIEMIDDKLFVDGVNVSTGKIKSASKAKWYLIGSFLGFVIGFITALLIT